MSNSITVLPLQTAIVDTSGSYSPVFVSAGSSIVVERDANTPAGDPVNVVFGGLSIGGASSVTVEASATLTLSDIIGLNVAGNFNIGAESTLIIPPSVAASIDVPTNFIGSHATLVSDQSGVALLSALTGFNASDTIDFRNVAAATAVQYTGGVLSILNGNTVVASATVSGPFSAATLTLAADGAGGFSVGDNLGDVNTRLSGARSQYSIAVDGSNDYVQDTVSGRDGSFLAAPGQILGFSDGILVSDPTGAAESVAHLYKAVLGRTPDLGGLEYFTNALNTGALNSSNLGPTFAAVAVPEFIARYGAVTDSQFVSILEQNTGGSLSDPSAQVAIAQLNAGMSRGSIAFMFAESPNGVAATASYAGDPDTAEVYRLYEATLSRAPDPGGSSTFTASLMNGAMPTQIANTLMTSTEYTSRFGGESNAVFVTQLYQNALDRAPDAGGAANWVNQLNAGGSRASIVVGIGDSLEARILTASATHDGSVFLHA